MSTRRQARAAASPTNLIAIDGVPQALAIGPCIEVWAVDPHGNPHGLARIFQARMRFRSATNRYFADQGLETTAQQAAAIRPRSHWSTQDYPDWLNETQVKALRKQAQGLLAPRTNQS